MVTEGLTKAEEQQVLELLNKVGSRMSAEFYNAVAAKFVLTAIETVPLRRRGDTVEVLLLERNPNDTFYAGQVHSPGSMLRASDQTYGDALRRVQWAELGLRFAEPPQFVSPLFQSTPRGPENGLVFACRLEAEPTIGKFHDVTSLPPNVIEHHRPIIQAATEFFRKL